jgi:Zn-dependent protease with chaperone function
MRRTCGIAIVCLLLIVTSLLPAAAQESQEPPGRDPAFEQEIYDRLGQIAPGAVPIFQEATRVMDAGDLEAARQGYEQVLALAPGFPDALRRLSYLEQQLGETEAALQHVEAAFAADPSPYNQSALARALLATEDPKHYADAFFHAQDAAQALPEDPEVQVALLWAALEYKDSDTIREASSKLTQLVPDYPVGHFYAGLSSAEDGKWEEAEEQLLVAQELGMPPAAVQEALDAGIRTQARMRRWLRWAGYGLVAWVVGLVLLFLVGTLLSKMTLAAVRHTQTSAEFEIGPGERLVRSVYRLVIAITSLYFYLSIPLLILIVLAVALGILYLFFVVGRIPVRLALFIGLAALYTLYAIVRSLFVRVKESEPGRPLTQEEAPHLWSLTKDVAGRLDTRPIDAIYITPATDIAVTERGGTWKKLRGQGQRFLILGLGALPGMTQGQFQAILAHEYGHFSHRDTAGGDLAHRVHAALVHMAYGLAASGQARWYNPAWLFVNGFNRIFLRITLGASRLQEILADRYAAMAFGVENFVSGLKHVIHQGLAFPVQVTTEIETALEQARDLHNLYALPPLDDEEQIDQLEEIEAEIMSRPTSPYDSHPAPSERIVLLEQLPEVDKVAERPALVWHLLPDAEELQAEMTDIVRANVRQAQG